MLNITGGTCFSDPGGQLNLTLWGPDPAQKVHASLFGDPKTPDPVVRRATISNNGVAVSYERRQHISRANIAPDAQATQSGNTYTITGTGWQAGTSSSKPFEITVTCS
jgi:lipoprotein antigen